MSFIALISKTFHQQKIPYAIVGGVAVALHGAPRGTIDLDIIVKHSAEVFRSVEGALKGLGFVTRLPVTADEVFNFKDEYIKRRNLIAWSFYNPANPLEVVDIILTHDLKDLKAVEKKMGLARIRVLSIEDLIAMKKSSARPQDLEDIKVLRDLLK